MVKYLKKGFYSIITSFLLIIVVIFSLLALLQFSGLSIKINKETSKNVDYMTNINIFKDQLLLCHEKTALAEEKLNNNKCSDLIEGVKGYSVEQQESQGCARKVWNFGQVDKTFGNYIFWVPVLQLDFKNCLAKLIVYY